LPLLDHHFKGEIAGSKRREVETRFSIRLAQDSPPGMGGRRKKIMKNRTFCAVLVLSMFFGVVPSPAQTPYHADVLGISDGRTGIQVEHATGMNRWGQVIGTYGGGLSGGTHAVLWTPNSANDGYSSGTLYPIENSRGLPVGTTLTWATGINDRGQVVGGAYTPGHGDDNQQQSWMWRPSPLNAVKGTTLNAGKGKAITFSLVQIPELDPFAEYNQVINNNGWIAAYNDYFILERWVPDQPNGTTSGKSWIYDTNQYCAPPSGINDAGQIAGSTCESTENVPYLHSGDLPLQATDLITSPLWPQPPDFTTIGAAGGLNQQGDLAVTAIDAANSQIHAYLYKNGVAIDVSTNLTSQADSVNNYDQIVGRIETDTRRAALFENGNALDLNTLNDASGLFLKEATVINDRGQILCIGLSSGNSISVLLTPAANWIQPVAFVRGALQKHGSTATQTITVTNKGANAIPGTVSIALDGLTPGATLTNATGLTQYAGPFGSPYVDVSASDLAPGATTAEFTLTFSYSGGGSIKYTPRVLATAAAR